MKEKIKEIISNMSVGQKKYETNRGKKKGFKKLEQWIEHKLLGEEKKKELNRIDEERQIWKQYKNLTISAIDYKTGKKIKVSPDKVEGIPDEYKKSPYFNVNYYLRNPNYVEGVSTKTSKEMMEWFFKSLENKTLDDFQDNGKPPHSNPAVYLYITWSLLLDKENSDNLGYNHDPVKWFNELEYLIKDNGLFWYLVHSVWCISSKQLNPKEMFQRYGRDKVSLEDRQKYLSHDEIFVNEVEKRITGEDDEKNSESVSPLGMLSFINSKYKSITRKGHKFIKVYRTFTIKENERIRGKDYYTQLGGANWNFSTSRYSATLVKSPINTYHYKKYSGRNEKDALKRMVRVGLINKSQRNHITHKSGYLNVIAEYIIKVSDILFATNRMGEEEVVVNPKNARLIKYRFLDEYDFLASRLANAQLSRIRELMVDGKGISKNLILNADSYFDLTRCVIENRAKDDPNFIKNRLEGRTDFSELNGQDLESLSKLKLSAVKIAKLIISHKEPSKNAFSSFLLWTMDDGKDYELEVSKSSDIDIPKFGKTVKFIEVEEEEEKEVA